MIKHFLFSTDSVRELIITYRGMYHRLDKLQSISVALAYGRASSENLEEWELQRMKRKPCRLHGPNVLFSLATFSAPSLGENRKKNAFQNTADCRSLVAKLVFPLETSKSLVWRTVIVHADTDIRRQRRLRPETTHRKQGKYTPFRLEDE